MLVSLGRKSPPTDIFDTILGCHARIRSHLSIAKRLADTTSADPSAIVDAAESVHRYFDEALPTHTIDEDVSLIPRMLGRSDRLDRVLAAMQEQHREHQQGVLELLEICDLIRSDVDHLAELQPRLQIVVGGLSHAYEEHLSLEERIIFPAARVLLSNTEKVALAEEVRHRHRKLPRYA